MMREVMMREVQTLRARKHQHIVPLLASWNDRSMESEYPVANLNILFPYSKVDLQRWMSQIEAPDEWRGVDSKLLKDYIYSSIMSLCDAVAYLHKPIEGLISSHHDLKPANILLYGKTWKIADFGRTHLISLSTGSDTEGGSGLGTFTYHPPEYWTSTGRRANVRHGRAFDIWALGCIAVEFLTVAVYGWSSEELRHFREKRRTNPTPLILFPDTSGSKDISFHNNMTIVKQWMLRLRKADGSFNINSMLGIVDKMLNVDPHGRLLSWEVYLDFHELLNPNNTTTEKAFETENRVQTPNPRHQKSEKNPLQRAVDGRNILRVKYLLKAGWSEYPANISNVDGRDDDEVIKMLQIAKLTKGIRFRRARKLLGYDV